MVREYIFLAVGCAAVGVMLTLVILGTAVRLNIDIEENLWLLALPAVLSLALNVTLLELYRKYREKR